MDIDWYSKTFTVTAFAAVQMIAFLSAVGTSSQLNRLLDPLATRIVVVGAIVISGAFYIWALLFLHHAHCAFHSTSCSEEHLVWIWRATMGQVVYIGLFQLFGAAVVLVHKPLPRDESGTK